MRKRKSVFWVQHEFPAENQKPADHKGPPYARVARNLDFPNYVPPRGHLNAVETN
jgi:hypothetical protein